MSLKKLATLSISRSFALIAGLAVVMSVTSAGLALYMARDDMMELKRAEVKNAVEAATTTVNSFLARVEKGELPEAEAKKMAIDALAGARFDGGNYYFVIGFNGISVSHANKKIETTDMTPLKDARGRFFIQDMIKLARDKGAGYIDYDWTKPGDKEASLKISYVMSVPKWQWLIGTGLHVHDVDAAFVRMTGDVAKVLVPLGLLMFGLVIVLSRRANGMLTSLSGTMNALAAGNLQTAIAHQDRPDEIGSMARALVIFRDAAVAKDAMEADKVRVEQEAAAHRDAADGQRRRSEAERAELSRTQEGVVAALGAGLEHLAEGDLTYRINENFGSDYAKLRDDFNAAIGKLQETMRQIATNTESMKAGSIEISQAGSLRRGDRDRARRTDRHRAADGRERASGQPGDDAGQGRGRAVDRDRARCRGGDGRHREIRRGDLADRRRDRRDRLPDQSAGAERQRRGRACRRCRQGLRGRRLRGAGARPALGGSRQGDQGADRRLQQRGRALQRMAQEITRATGLVSEIASAAQEQASGLQEVNTAVGEMDQSTQQNAAMAEQSTAAAHSLSQEADRLAALVARFQLGGDVAGLKAMARTMHAAAAPAPRKSAPPVARPVARPVAAAAGASPARKADMSAHDKGWAEF